MPLSALSFCRTILRSNTWDASFYGRFGVYMYLGSFALPMRFDVSLIMLACCAALSLLRHERHAAYFRQPLVAPLALFLGAIALSTLASVDQGRSMQLSAVFIPALLLFFLITTHVQTPSEIRGLYLACAVMGVSLASLVLWVGWQRSVWQLDHMVIREALMLAIHSPLLIAPNDIALLGVIAPLSAVLLLREPWRAPGIIAALSLLLSLAAICLLQSALALLTMLVALAVPAALLCSRRALVVCSIALLGILLFVVLLDSVLGFAFITRTSVWWRWSLEARIRMWKAAWRLFLSAPVLGHGPHTFAHFYPRLPWAHNLYLEVLAEQGSVGLLALGFSLVRSIRMAWATVHSAADDRRVLMASALGGLLGLCSAGLLEMSLMRQWVVVMLCVFLGVIARLSAYQS